MLVEAWHDQEIARWNPVPPEPTPERARHWIEGAATRLDQGRSLDLCIVDDTDVVVGEVGLSGFDEARRAAMIGYWLLPRARGRGLASLAVATLSGWAISDLGLQLLVARCATANLASQAVARRSGYAHGRHDRGHELYVRRAGPPGP